MARPRKPIAAQRKCVHCGRELDDKEFYKSHGSIYVGDNNYLPVCKDCIKTLYEEYETKYTNQFSVLDDIEPEANEIKKLTVKRICMAFDIYYSDWLFETALKQIEKFPILDMITAYMRVANLKQNCKKSYDNTITEENLSQELVKSSMVDKVREKFDDSGLYQDIYNLCLKLLQSLRGNCNINFSSYDFNAND